MSRNKKGDFIKLRGVRQNNLKGFDLDLAMNRLIVITGPSGSGKSSLAFDTLYAEGQRRYIETFSPYARQFFDRMDKPRVDSIESIPPAIAIEQKNSVKTIRSTVGTMTEICDYMKVVMPVISKLYCKGCGQVVKRESPQDIWEALTEQFSTSSVTDLIVAFNLNLSEKLSLKESLNLITKQGYQRILIDGEVVRIDDVKNAPGNKKPAVLVIVQDRLRFELSAHSRFIDACEQSYHYGKGNLSIYYKSANHSEDRWQNPPLNFSNRLHCARCNIAYEEPSSSLFSYNHPLGACKTCHGFGRIVGIDYNLVIPNPNLSIADGVIRPWQSGFSTESQEDLINFCKKRGVPINVPFEQLTPEHKKWIIEGDKDYGIDEDHSWHNLWYGVKGYFDWLEGRSYKMHVRVLLSRYRSYTTCPDCKGARFQPDVLLYKFEIDSALAERLKKERKCSSNLITIAELYLIPINEALEVVKSIRSKARLKDKNPAILALDEVVSRLEYLAKIGLGYLTLNRPSRTLSGGETERVNLTACLGSRLVNTLYILDEPSVGLHPRDTDRLISTLKNLRDIGNTVVVVEHEPSVITSADQIVDLGPGSGEAGGNLVFQGEFKQLLTHPSSLTGLYLSGRKRIQIPPRRPVKEIKNGELASPVLTLSNASRHNLKNITVDIPLKRFVCITGVSGSGKSTLTRECLLPILQRRIFLKKTNDESLIVNEDKNDQEDDSRYGNMMDVSGWELIDYVTFVDQSPLGKTPRSNPAVYIGAFNYIRELFANSPSAISHSFTVSSFSFNCAEGKCEKCNGAGYEKIEMQFLSDIFIKCPECDGRRYKKEILEIKISPNGKSMNAKNSKALNITEVLDSTIDEMIDWLKFFTGSKPAERALKMLGILKKVGLGYIRLGQPITTLSGGECQRLKLARCLAEVVEKQSSNREKMTDEFNAPSSILFLFDEPTTGLHFDDVRVLLNAFNELVNQGHSVVVIEHNLEVIKCADWIIDLGPEAGDNGGKIVICGTPEDVANCPSSYTGKALKNIL